MESHQAAYNCKAIRQGEERVIDCLTRASIVLAIIKFCDIIIETDIVLLFNRAND